MGYNSDAIRNLYRLIDWMMRLRPDLSRRFVAELVAFEKETQMPFVTSAELYGHERGQKEERQRSDKLLLRMLTDAVGQIPADLQEQIQQLTDSQRLALVSAIRKFKSVEDLNAWLRAPAVDEANNAE